MERAATGPGHRAHANLYWTYHTRAGRTAGTVEPRMSTSAARPVRA